MSCKQRVRTLISLTLSFYLCAFKASRAKSLAETLVEESNARSDWTEGNNDFQQGKWRLVEQVILGSDELHTESAAFVEETVPYSRPLKPGETGEAATSLSWTIGKVKRKPSSSASDAEDGYQADTGFPSGFEEAKGTILTPSFTSSPHYSAWLAMRPLVHCGYDFMTFTASGGGFFHLLVDRGGASPIPLFELPSHCGYSVKTSPSDLQMMVPFNACYITQENGSYVLPMLWWDSLLKLSCPVQMIPPMAPSVFCSSHGLAVQIDGQQQDILMLGAIVNGGWEPFVSEDCAHQVSSNPGKLNFFISYSAPCITSADGLLQFIFDNQEYTLSCPVTHQSPYIPHHPPSPSDPKVPYVPDPVSPTPTFPLPPTPQPPTQEQIVHFPEYPIYPGFLHPQLPEVYPPGSQPTHPLQPTPGGPSGPQPGQQQQQQQQQLQQQQQQFFFPTGSGEQPYSPGEYPEYSSPFPHLLAQSFINLSPVQDHSHHTGPHSPNSASQDASGFYEVRMPLYHAGTPAQSTIGHPDTQKPMPPGSLDYPYYYLQIPDYPAHPADSEIQAPVTGPSSPPPPSLPKQPMGPHYPVNPFYLPASFYYYYNLGQFSYPKPGLEVQQISTFHPTPAPSSPPTTTTTTTTTVPKQPNIPSYASGQFYPQGFNNLPAPTSPLQAKEKPQTIPPEPVFPQAICPPYSHIFCGYFLPYPNYHPLPLAHYPPPHSQVPQYPQTPPTVTTTTAAPVSTTTKTTSTPVFSPSRPSPQAPQIQCLMGMMNVFLPFADQDYIQIRDQMKTWLPLSTVPRLCGYTVNDTDSGVIFRSPLPACHSEPWTPTTISLPLRFWDRSIEKNRTVDLQCPYQTTPVTPTPATPPPTPVSPTNPPVALKPTVVCSSHLMTVELPSGPVSGVVVKDIRGNQMNLQDAPEHCGYSARTGKDGKVYLSLQLQSRCLMTVQDKMYTITVLYETVSGRRKAQLFCPVFIPGSGQECNLPSEQRLPCGPGSVSQPQCLSIGCCFSEQPPACYYPMDVCTIDRHFVFSVPASLTEPPLSPALLVAAGNATCVPARVTSDYALFKIPMNGCGARRVMVAKTVIYIVEIINRIQTISLNYGTITRDSPVRLLVECRYLPDTVVSASYMVKTPSLGPAIQIPGIFGVQLRIAKDAQYSSYYPQYHQPLEMLLGKPLYLEVRLLNAPDPALVLLVHYCVAYPRSGKAIWLLLYNGCPNPLDPAPQKTLVVDPQSPSPPAQTRRFTISTFQFLPDGEFKDMTEEIYFMCSTEICLPRDRPCVEGCFGQ